MPCDHISKVLGWSVNDRADLIPSGYGCTRCDAVSEEPLSNGNLATIHEHTSFVEGCFSCKIQTLQLNTGDADSGWSSSNMTRKRWDRELDAYSSARRQGVQPSGTSMEKITAAMEISNKTGTAYQAG